MIKQVFLWKLTDTKVGQGSLCCMQCLGITLKVKQAFTICHCWGKVLLQVHKRNCLIIFGVLSLKKWKWRLSAIWGLKVSNTQLCLRLGGVKAKKKWRIRKIHRQSLTFVGWKIFSFLKAGNHSRLECEQAVVDDENVEVGGQLHLAFVTLATGIRLKI